jgi:hypothetical protein
MHVVATPERSPGARRARMQRAPMRYGIDRVLIVSTDGIDVPGLRIEQHRNAVDAR